MNQSAPLRQPLINNDHLVELGSNISQPSKLSFNYSIHNSLSSANKAEYEYLFKLVLIGDVNCGKSCIIRRFVDDSYDNSTMLYAPTIGVDFNFRTIEINHHIIRLQIWDTAGQERFRKITSSYYKGANAILVVFDITDRHSFENIHTWLMEVAQYTDDNCIRILIGNKSDLDFNEQRGVSQKEAEIYANEQNMIFVETSAKTGVNIEKVFLLCGKKLLDIAIVQSQIMSEQEMLAFRELKSDKMGESDCCCRIL